MEFARFLRALSSTGVITAIGNTLAVTAGPGLGVTVATGMAALQGYWYYSDATQTVALLAADPTNPRIDRIIIRLTISTKTVELTKLTGTPAGSPVAPTLTQGADVYEIPLCQVAVAAGASSITSGNLTDQRAYAGPSVHDMITAHAASGLTTGHVLRATGAASFAFGQAAHTDFSAIGTNSHAAIDTHIAASAAVHGLPASTNVLGNKDAAGEFIQRGNKGTITTGSSAFPQQYLGTGAVTFAVAFAATPFVWAAGSTQGSANSYGAHNAATTGFTLDVWSDTASFGYANVRWVALGA